MEYPETVNRLSPLKLALGTAGVVIGLFTLGILFGSPSAKAAEPPTPPSPIQTLVNNATSSVQPALAPVIKPVVETLTPTIRPITTPVVSAVRTVASPIVSTVTPITNPPVTAVNNLTTPALTSLNGAIAPIVTSTVLPVTAATGGAIGQLNQQVITPIVDPIVIPITDPIFSKLPNPTTITSPILENLSIAPQSSETFGIPGAASDVQLTSLPVSLKLKKAPGTPNPATPTGYPVNAATLTLNTLGSSRGNSSNSSFAAYLTDPNSTILALTNNSIFGSVLEPASVTYDHDTSPD